MIHSEAEEFLLAYVEGALDRNLRACVEEHTKACSACRKWVEAYHHLSRELSIAAEIAHPSSEVLARHAVRPHAVSDAEGMDIERHLNACPECAEDLALLRSAVLEARPSAPREPWTVGDWRKVQGRYRHLLVAAVLLVAIAAGFFVSLGLRRTGEAEAEGSRSRALAATSPQAMETGDISDAEIDGIRVIESRSGLRIANLRVKNGARVIIRAGGGVAFGDGFKVESGASLAVDGGSLRQPH